MERSSYTTTAHFLSSEAPSIAPFFEAQKKNWIPSSRCNTSTYILSLAQDKWKWNTYIYYRIEGEIQDKVECETSYEILVILESTHRKEAAVGEF